MEEYVQTITTWEFSILNKETFSEMKPSLLLHL